ncbi:MAG: acyl-CoA-binding protein [Acidobacteriia bacterium]|nr:acyl-CoA-binding protein [Terriglobia bacterium]
MSDLEGQFRQAQQDVNGLSQRPDDATLLRLYAFYKQATAGDAAGERPGALDFVRRAKYDAWSELKGMTQEEAMRKYVELADKLRG